MKKIKILKNNSQSFLDDLKKAKSVMVHAEKTNDYIPITKKDLISTAETKRIEYFKSENIGIPNEFTIIVL